LIRFALIIAFTGGVAAAEPPSMSRIVPAAIAPAGATEISLHGDNLEQSTALWTSFEAKIEKLSAGRDRAVFRIEPLKKIGAGIGMLRVIGSNGVSPQKFVMLDGLPTLAGGQTNDAAASAQFLKYPTAVEGECRPKTSSFYRFNGRKGERVIFDVVAQRLGSALDPVARLIDAQGRELLFCEDTPGAGVDCRFAWKFEKSGSYLMELRDTRYGGGADFQFRLRIAEPGREPFPLPFLAGPELSRASARLPRIAESEPNDAQFQRVEVPCTIEGKLEKPKDRDGYEFEARKGQNLVLRSRSRSLGSACDVYLRLQDSSGKMIAESVMGGSEEAGITNKFNASGKYQLVVEEATRLGGPEFFYEVDVAPFHAGFGLSLDNDTVHASPGGSFEIKVLPNRPGGFDGPIKLSLEGPGETLVLLTNLVTTKTNAAAIRIKVSESANPAQLLQFKVRGTAKVDGEEFSTMASTLPAMRKEFPHLLWPPPELDGWIALGVKQKSD
jgi:hypothetical protein